MLYIEKQKYNQHKEIKEWKLLNKQWEDHLLFFNKKKHITEVPRRTQMTIKTVSFRVRVGTH